DLDISQMLQTLLNFKESDPLWVVKPYLEPLFRRLTIISAINEIYPNTSHLLCIFYVDMNLHKKLKSKLGSRFEEFQQKFYACRNSLCNKLFKAQWTYLISEYPESAKYMLETLYTNKESWANVQSTQRIESINKLIHNKVDQATSLYNLLATIDSCVKNKEQFEKSEIERNVLPRVGLLSLNNRFFKEVDNIIKQFLTPIILGKQHQQMNQSVCYDVNCIVEWNQLIA
ncbi:2544_t:CDS:2, partial [Cetraspora pellucida]